jgi:hypothetical protein
MNKAGRLVLVKHVLTSMVIYLCIAMDLPLGPQRVTKSEGIFFGWEEERPMGGIA